MNRILLVVVAVLLFFAYQEGYLDNFISETKIASKEISKLSCEKDIKPLAKGKSLKNMFGMTFEIIKVKNITEKSRTKDEISCEGEALFDNGKNSKLLMRVFRDNDNEIMYEFKQLLN